MSNHPEIGALFALLGFVVGFFTNLLAMRKMFASKGEFKEFKEDTGKAIVEVRSNITRMVADSRVDMDALCTTKRMSCSGMLETVKKIDRSVDELFKLVRENYGDLMRVVGEREGYNRAKM
jgi:hypothetical protein